MFEGLGRAKRKNRVNNAMYDFERIANDSKFEDDHGKTLCAQQVRGHERGPRLGHAVAERGEGGLPNEYTATCPSTTPTTGRMYDESVEHTQQWIEQHANTSNLLLDASCSTSGA